MKWMGNGNNQVECKINETEVAFVCISSDNKQIKAFVILRLVSCILLR